MKTIKKEIFAVIIAVIITVLLAYGFVKIAARPAHDFETTTYCVDRGETLWSIAKQYCPDDMDIRDYIKLIINENELTTTTLQPGQILTVFEEV